MKFLIVDDEPLIRRSLRRASELRKHEVQEASNGLEGLEKWTQFQPDLVFLDVLMPVMDGPTLLLKRPLGKTSKVILISAFTGEYDGAKARSLGADVFIPKPFDNIFDIILRAEELVKHGPK